jgi:hypothetical protein
VSGSVHESNVASPDASVLSRFKWLTWAVLAFRMIPIVSSFCVMRDAVARYWTDEHTPDIRVSPCMRVRTTSQWNGLSPSGSISSLMTKRPNSSRQ